ncbi:MAG: EMC3/TMCO1 family protein [Candidatus Nitrosopelagicus sp.]|nr:EMC3/TMCO1 family protein [Candidatus Nitrosopelagicus sp.]
MEFNIILNFIDVLFLQMDMFGIREGPLGSADPMVKGMIPSFFGMVGFAILLNLFNSGIRRKMVDQVKWRRITKEVRSWQKERMAAFRSKDQERIAKANKKSAYMNKMNMEMMQMNIRPMMITIIPLLLIFYFVLPQLFSYTVGISPIPLNVIPGDWFELTCTAAKVAEAQYCGQENEIYLWAMYFLASIAFSGIIMKVTKTQMDLG